MSDVKAFLDTSPLPTTVESQERKERQISILAWMVSGPFAGFIANKIVGGLGQGLVLDIVVGIVGRKSF